MGFQKARLKAVLELHVSRKIFPLKISATNPTTTHTHKKLYMCTQGGVEEMKHKQASPAVLTAMGRPPTPLWWHIPCLYRMRRGVEQSTCSHAFFVLF